MLVRTPAASGSLRREPAAATEPARGWRRLREAGDSVWALGAVAAALFLLYQAAAGF